MSTNSTRESVNTYLKLTNILSNIIHHSQHLFQKETILSSFHTAIDSLAKSTVSILEWNLCLLIVLNYLKYIFLKHLNSNLAALMKANYIKQLSKVKHTYKRFKREYNLLFHFLAIFKQISQFLTQYDKFSHALEILYSIAPFPVAFLTTSSSS